MSEELGDAVATIRDVAEMVGISESTVSRALRGVGRVSPATVRRVREAAHALNFTLSKSASSLASGRTMRVTLLFAKPLNVWFNASVMEGAYEVLSAAGYDLVPQVTSSLEQLHDYFRMLPGNRNSDGLLVASFMLDESQAQVLSALTIPSVGLDSRNTDGFDASVRLDEDGAMLSAVRLLHGLGHRRIGFVGRPNPGDFDTYSAGIRSIAFHHAARSLGYDEIMLSDMQVVNDRPGDDYGKVIDKAAADVVARLLAMGRRPTGICVATDEFAVAVVDRLRAVGLRVPEDLSVIGFDDSDVAAQAGLTTIHQDPVSMARMGAGKLVRLMRGESLDDPHGKVGTSLVLRGTTGRYQGYGR